MTKTKNDLNGTPREVTPPLRRKRATAAMPPPDGATLRTVTVHFHVSSQGYATHIEAVWDQPGTRPGYAAQDEAQRYAVTGYRPYHTRPGLRKLLQDAARDVWAISTSQSAHALDGEEPLPGL